MDEQSIRWTVRLSLLVLYGVLIRQAFGSGHTRGDRMAWSVGCMLMIVHVLLAFHFAHHWSHAAAVAETARQTEAVVGRAFGGGVWWNYVFMLTWLVDVAWWWTRPASYLQRAAWIRWALAGFWIFIAVNATVVFESGPTRWIGGVLSGLWLIAILARSRGRS